VNAVSPAANILRHRPKVNRRRPETRRADRLGDQLDQPAALPAARSAGWSTGCWSRGRSTVLTQGLDHIRARAAAQGFALAPPP
jgi:hypothetical protein